MEKVLEDVFPSVFLKYISKSWSIGNRKNLGQYLDGTWQSKAI